MTPQDFIAQWGAPDGVPGPSYALNEEQGAQSHFLGLCDLLGVPKPGSMEGYRFEEKSAVIGGKTGYADVFMPGVFAWENKAPGKNLDAALKQLLTYSLALSNPPILVVSDRLTIRIHTQFTGHPSQAHSVSLYELDQPDKLALLRRIWHAPESFKPKETNRDITEAAAKSFATLAEGLRRRGADPHPRAAQTPAPDPLRPSVPAPASAPSTTAGADDAVANRVAHFLTQCLFCFFAEDVGLLPSRMFERLVNSRTITPAKLTQGLADLFTAMSQGGMFGADDIAWFNGGLFKRVDVPTLSILDVTELRNAASLNWSAIDVSIFGTLFERGLDPAKRSQLGAHYTDTATIDRIIDPVLRRPLLQKWQLVAQDIQGLQAKSTKKGDKAYREAQARFIGWLEALASYRILDPACGSGNFLFLGLKALKDIEHQSHLEAAALGLDREADLVTGPHNVLGIELNEYAAELARVTVWIGELQWRMAHGYEFKTNPVLEPLDHIECRDALLCFSTDPILGTPAMGARFEPGSRAAQTPEPHTLRFLKSALTSAPPTPLSAVGLQAVEESVGPDPNFAHSVMGLQAAGIPKALAGMGSDPDFAQQNSGSDPTSAGSAKAMTSVTEAPWPRANIVIGNPPFLGGSKKRRELGDAYFDALNTVFSGRVPGGADLVCYWFDKARVAIEGGELEAAGLVATQSIRAGSNREVLTALCATTTIFDAWADEPWVNEGAAVRVSLVCFGLGETAAQLNGQPVPHINADLTGVVGVDMTQARTLPENAVASFEGTKKYGDFDVTGELARQWLRTPNPHGPSNSLVVKPWRNGQDLSQRPRGTWIIDFGTAMSEGDAALFDAPFTHALLRVKPERQKVRRERTARLWWLHEEARVSMRKALSSLPRYLATPRVSKHRFFVFLHASVLPDTRLNVLARADDTTFGILSSRIHEVWSLAQASMHGVGNDPTYNAKSCFETFPFPPGLTPADTAHQQTETLPNGAIIPLLSASCIENMPLALTDKGPVATKIKSKGKPAACANASEVGLARMSGAISKSEAYEPPASEPAPPGESLTTQVSKPQTTQASEPVMAQAANQAANQAAEQAAEQATTPRARASTQNQPLALVNQGQAAIHTEAINITRQHAERVATAAKRLNDLREAWLNPPEWTHRVPEVVPLGMSTSPYPDRIEPRHGISEADLKALQKRTLTNLYNAAPAWLTLAHQQLDLAVAAAYGWADYSPAMADDEILRRLLALNLARSGTISDQPEPQKP